MKLLSILALLLAVSCSSKTTGCKVNGDCNSGTQVCDTNSETCVAESANNCKTNAACPTGSGLTCDTNRAICACGGSTTTSGATCKTTESCLSGSCKSQRRVFVTSQMFSPGTAYSSSNCFPASGTKTCTFNSAANADAACQDFADQQKLGGKWAAWIATSTQPAIERIIPSRIVDGDTADVYLIDNTKISGPVTMTKAKGNFASSCAGTSGSDCPDTHTNPINKTEAGGSPLGDLTVYTGIDKSDFDKSASKSSTCNDWNSNSSSFNFYYGNSSNSDRTWHSAGSVACPSLQHLYCLEVNQ